MSRAMIKCAPNAADEAGVGPITSQREAKSRAQVEEDTSWQWALTQGRLRRQLERLREALTLEEKSLVVLESRAEYGVAAGEKPLSEGGLFKREAMIDKAMDRYERVVKEAEKRRKEAGSSDYDEVWLKERAVMMEILVEHPAILEIFEEKMNAVEA
jgi:hypothetical protein